MRRSYYLELEGGRGFRSLVVLAGVLVAGGLLSSWYMFEYGHIVSGMSNQVIWALPHVVAFFLLVSASGALNIDTMARVFGRTVYTPLARLSGLLALALLVGGLAILVLDLGRPDRLMVDMVNSNFKSVFDWNKVMYVGFATILAGYLFLQMARGFERWVAPVGLLAFIWRFMLTTCSGSVLGFLVARQAFSPIMAPLFISMSLVLGQAIFLLVIMAVCAGSGRPIGTNLLNRMARLLGIFTAATLYFAAVQHLGTLYAARNAAEEQFILFDGGIYPALFWIGYVVLGSLLPIGLVFSPAARQSRPVMGFAALLAVLGGFALLYVTIIGAQAYPLQLFPGMQVASSFGDGAIAFYQPSLPEIALGIGGLAIAALVTIIGVRLLPVVPMDLEDKTVELQARELAAEGSLAG